MDSLIEVAITYLPRVNCLIIRKQGKAFITTKDAVIFDRDMFIQMIHAMVKNEQIDYKVLEGILEDFHTA
jgi:hypothetical protein